jgi:hypothetical protein
MTTEDLIMKIVYEIHRFKSGIIHQDKDEVIVTVSKKRGEEIIQYILETEHGLYISKISYKSLTLYDYRVVFSEMLKDDEIVIGLKIN